MIQSLFQFVRPHVNENHKIENLKSLLKQSLAWESFEDIYAEFGDDVGEKISTFVIFMYCTDSTYFIADGYYEATKIGIAELCGLDAEKYHDVLHLKNTGVVKAINFVASEMKSWQFKKMINFRESAATLGKLSTQEPDPKSKNSAKNIRDAAVFEKELQEEADHLEQQIFSKSRSTERLKETLSVNIEAMSWEAILKGVK